MFCRGVLSFHAAVAACVAALSAVVAYGQSPRVRLARDHQAIQYSSGATSHAIDRLNARLASGALELAFDASPRGYLASVLQALDVSPSSQLLVFSENSLQRAHISKATPRAIYFNDTVAVSWAKGAETIEAAVLDPRQGVHFYSIAQAPSATVRFGRRTDCLECHLMPQTLGVPGLFAMSVLPLSDDKNDYAQGWEMDHRTPIEDRWGGWYVTGAQVPRAHLGNVPVLHVPKSYVRADVAPVLATGHDAFDASPYLTPHSDVVAHLVFDHQLHVTNLLIRLGWEWRTGQKIADTVDELVDYLLFVDEAPLPSVVRGLSGFADDFQRRGPRDAKGRSLRQLDLTARLFRHPCSYMIYTEAFDALPDAAREAVYGRLWSVLSGADTHKAYDRLSSADRRAIIEILKDTKQGLSAYFR